MTWAAFVALVMIVAILFLIALSLPQSILFAALAVGVVIGVSNVPSRG